MVFVVFDVWYISFVVNKTCFAVEVVVVVVEVVLVEVVVVVEVEKGGFLDNFSTTILNNTERRTAELDIKHTIHVV